ncbi:MAG: aldo/keto reductase [Bacteroidales bacterium]|jgi:diketogulonate reductase-like aldo/keto reductase|nr:aldo/keto reductase [Bacteroidales bacterium]
MSNNHSQEEKVKDVYPPVTRHFQLNNGVSIPLIGIGPRITGVAFSIDDADAGLWRFAKRVYNKLELKLLRGRRFTQSVANGFRAGFTLFDYSVSYGWEHLIGRAIKQSGIDRRELFLTTRVTNKQQEKGNIREQLFKTLKQYRTDYVDLYMFHWPVPEVYLDTWKQMERLYKEGYCRAIGVANCHRSHLEKICKMAEIIPQVNQIEAHPLFTQKPLISYCKSKNIAVEAYSPIARNDDRLVNLPKLKAVAKKYNKSVIQIILRWHIQNEIIPIVRSLNKRRQIEDISIFDFKLTEDEMKTIDGFNINSRLRFDPDNCDFSIL